MAVLTVNGAAPHAETTIPTQSPGVCDAQCRQAIRTNRANAIARKTRLWNERRRDEQCKQLVGSAHASALRAVERAMGDLETWPGRPAYPMQSYAMSSELKNTQRFSFVVFLHANGVSPELVVELLVASGNLRDVQAVQQISYLLRNLRSGVMQKYKGYNVFAGEWQASIAPYLPPSERDFFGLAQAALRAHANRLRRA